MDRRSAITLLGATVALAGSASSAAAQTAKSEDPHAECLENCNDCRDKCERTFNWTLRNGKPEHLKLSQLLVDCSEFCALSATLISRRSALMDIAALACADACKECLAECERFSDSEIILCAQSCRECEKSCREMVDRMRKHA